VTAYNVTVEMCNSKYCKVRAYETDFKNKLIPSRLILTTT